MALTRWVGRAIGLDVHRGFCVVAICEDGEVRSGARVPSTPEGLEQLGQSLVRSDRVALEVTGSCWEVARILEGHVDRVVVVSPDDTGITRAQDPGPNHADRDRRRPTGLTGADLRPSARHPRPIRRRKTPQIPSNA